jgi:hypothetical protein
MAAASALAAFNAHAPTTRAVGFVGILFFGAGVFILLWQGISPVKSGLLLDRDGFEVRSAFATKRYRWDDVSAFGVFRYRFNRFVGFQLTPTARPPRLAAINRALVGWDAMLPNTLRLKPEQLAALMEEWRLRHAANRP